MRKKIVWEPGKHGPALSTYLYVDDDYCGMVSDWGPMAKGRYLALTAPSIGEVLAWFIKESDARKWLLTSVLMERAIK